jgi:hypothetical protein
LPTLVAPSAAKTAHLALLTVVVLLCILTVLVDVVDFVDIGLVVVPEAAVDAVTLHEGSSLVSAVGWARSLRPPLPFVRRS